MASRISLIHAAEQPHLVNLLSGDVDLDLFFDVEAFDDEAFDAVLSSQQPVKVWSLGVSELEH